MKSLIFLSIFYILTQITFQAEIMLTNIKYSDEVTDDEENDGRSKLIGVLPHFLESNLKLNSQEIKYIMKNWKEVPGKYELEKDGNENKQTHKDSSMKMGFKLATEDSAKRWEEEQAAGNPAEIYGNRHYYQPDSYKDFSRRFVPQYQYIEAKDIQKNNIAQNVAPEGKEIVPIKAPLELVELAAKEAALKEAKKPKDSGEDSARNNILRTGDYWNSVWVEEMDPSKPPLRTMKNQALGTIKAKVQPGSEFYQVASRMKKMSPKLLYIINENQ